MWRYLKVFLVAVVVIAVAKTFIHDRQGKRADEEIPRLVAKQQAMLPVKISEQIELTDVSYENRTLHYDAKSSTWFERSPEEAQSVEQGLKTKYCKDMTAFVNAGVSVEFEIKIPPKTLNDHTSTTQVALHPGDCR